jgi:hypothetical protein
LDKLWTGIEGGGGRREEDIQTFCGEGVEERKGMDGVCLVLKSPYYSLWHIFSFLFLSP